MPEFDQTKQKSVQTRERESAVAVTPGPSASPQKPDASEKAAEKQNGQNNYRCFDECHPPRHHKGAQRHDVYHCFDEYHGDKEASASNEKKSFRGLRKFFRGLMYVLFAVTLSAALTASFLSHYLMDPEGLKKAILTEEFDQATLQAVRDAIQEDATVAELDPEAIISGLEERYILQYEHDYTALLIHSLLDGSSPVVEPYLCSGLEEAIRRNLGDAANDLTAEELAGMVDYTRENIDKALEYVPSIVMEYLGKLTRLLPKMQIFLSLKLPFYGLAGVILLVTFLLEGKRHWRDILVGCTGVSWLALTALEVPLLILLIYNVPSHLILSQQTLFYFFKGLCRALVTNGAMFFGLAWLIALAALALAVYVRVKAHLRHVRLARQHRGTFLANFDSANDTVRMEYHEE